MLPVELRTSLRCGRSGRADAFAAAEARESRAAEPAVASSSCAATTSASIQTEAGAFGANDLLPTPACVDDLARDVYCLFGVPIDVTDMALALRRIEASVASATPFLLSTPNVNFLVQSQSDPAFRESLLDSDFCPADGMPIVWVARLMGLPIKQRVSGSDIFDALKTHPRFERPLRVFLFGGLDGVAAAAGKVLNAERSALCCVGTFNPGFGTVEDMNREDIIDTVNGSHADLLLVSLGSRKGQAWLHRNHIRLTIPVRVHLGAVLNFVAGTVKRAPRWLRACGLEWLWRIKEEPELWRRYCYDASVLLRLILTRALPLAITNRWHRLRSARQPTHLLIKTAQNHNSVTIDLCGNATERDVAMALSCFRETLTAGSKAVIIDLSRTRVIDQRFFGLLLMFRKQLKRRRAKLRFTGVSAATKRIFKLNALGFLLTPDASE